MTNSMIPYSFIPGTKAKATEVNANFLSLAGFIEQNKMIAANDILTIKDLLTEKADKTELITEFTITEPETDLNNYKTKGTYIFSSLYTPLNIPKGESGMLIVTGNENSVIKQTWYSNGEITEIFTRDFSNSAWGEWQSSCGVLLEENPGYLKLSNSLLIQWGQSTTKAVVYPLAYSTIAFPIYQKIGYGTSTERSDTGFTEQSLTGFTGGTNGVFKGLNWISIGY